VERCRGAVSGACGAVREAVLPWPAGGRRARVRGPRDPRLGLLRRRRAAPAAPLRRRHPRRARALLLPARAPGMGDRVRLTEAEVWAALAEVPDPEIPVISVVDLGVVRDVRVEDQRVHVEFTPTFLGCPALEAMRAQMADRIARLGAEPEVEVVLDDSWSTDRITPEGREKLRAAGFAPPTPRGEGPTLVQLQSNGF